MQILRSMRAAAFGALLMTTGCATGPTVRVDMDPSANLRSYKTFAFFEPVSTDDNKYTTLTSTRLKQSTRAQLERLGFVYIDEEEPDLRVNFYLKVVDKQALQSTGSNYYTYRGDRYGTWSGYPNVTTVDYREGTLIVELVDAKRKQLVWQGVAEGEIKEKALKNPGPALDRAVTKIFSNFPYEPE